VVHCRQVEDDAAAEVVGSHARVSGEGAGDGGRPLSLDRLASDTPWAWWRFDLQIARTVYCYKLL
jgi:hypothetical protein